MTPLIHSQWDTPLGFRKAGGLASSFVACGHAFLQQLIGLGFLLYPCNREKITGPFEDRTSTLVSLVLGFNQWIWDYIEANK